MMPGWLWAVEAKKLRVFLKETIKRKHVMQMNKTGHLNDRYMRVQVSKNKNKTNLICWLFISLHSFFPHSFSPFSAFQTWQQLSGLQLFVSDISSTLCRMTDL